MRAARALALAASLVPAAPGAQPLRLGEVAERGGTVIGRVCLDADGDGRCGPGEPGVAGARLLGEGGAVALADGDGRFHLLEVPARVLRPDRAAYGGHAVTAEGLGATRAFELAPLGAVQIELAVPPAPARQPPSVAPGLAPGGAPERLADGRLRWDLGGRTAPGARLVAGGERAIAGPDGAFSLPVVLAPGENRLAVLVVAPDGGAALHAWKVHLARRREGGDLVAPERPEPLFPFQVSARRGGALVTGRLAPGLGVRVGGTAARPAPDGSFAAFAPSSHATLEVVDAGGRVLAAGALPPGADEGLRGVGMAELEVSFLGDPGVLVTGRGAGAARGRIGPLELEAGVDLDDRDRDDALADLARPRDGLVTEHALDPARTLAEPGDDGAAGDLNAPRGRAWARARADGLRLDLGAARAGITGGELGRYDRALFGAKALAARAVGPVRVEAGAFGATLREDARGNAPAAPAHDVLAATGGASLWLAHGDVVPGSEALRVEWRDPLTGRVARQARLVRGEDYEIDWTSGRVVLATPLASVGGAPSVATGDPFLAPRAEVIADYLHAVAGSAAEDLHGGRLGAAVGPLALSAHGAREERTEGSWSLAAGRVTLDLGPRLRVHGEAARSEGTLFVRGGGPGFVRSTDGGHAFGAAPAPGGGANAVHVDASGGAGPARLAAWWREREAGYSDGEFLEARDARERGAELTVLGTALSGSALWAERRGPDPADPAGLAPLDATRAVVRAGWRGDRLDLVAEGVHAVTDTALHGEETSAGLRAGWRVDPALSVELSHHQGVRVEGEGARDPTFTAAGASLVRRRETLAVRGGWGPEVGPRLLVSVERRGPGEAVYGTFTADPDAPDLLGGRSEVSALGARRRAGGAEVFAEEQFGRDAFGLRTARVFGASLEPAAGLRVSLTGERGERLRLDGSRAARRGGAGAAGAVMGPLRLAVRGELRAEGDGSQAAAGGAAEWRAGPGLAFSLRAGWVNGSFEGRRGLGFDATLAGALRRERASVLASLSRVAERRPGAVRRDAVLARLATAARASRVELGLGAGVSLQEAAGGRDDRLAGSVRTRVRLAGPLDAAVEYARRASLRGGALGALDAVRAEAGVTEGENRLALGYTFVGFGGDGLTPAADTGRLYVRAQLAY